MADPPPPPVDDAASSFAWYIARCEAGDPLDFEAWLAEHPEHQDELRNLHAAWQQDAPPEASFFHRRKSEESQDVATGPLAPGVKIGDFHLVKLLGRGGMGEVWEAKQASLDRRVALKLLLPGRGSDTAIEFFEREARAGGRLNHPGIIAVHASGKDRSLHWISMELVEDGCTLADFLDDTRAKGELAQNYYTQVADLIARIADAVGAAHEAGVIHRDLKPLNVLIGEDDAPKISDFGLARVVDEHSLSLTGDFAGTYFYMSPEQVMARRMGIDHRSDIFSLGVMMYELLTLARPFQGDTTHQIAEQIVMHDPPDPQKIRSKVPIELSVICGKALEKKPGDRYASMTELAADLRRHLNNEPILARPPSLVQRTVKWVRRNPAKSAAGTIAALALVAISLLWLQAEEQKQKALDAEGRAKLALTQVEKEKQATAAALGTAKAERKAALAAKEEAANQKDQAEQRAGELQQISDFQAGQLASVDAQAMGLTIRSLVLERARAAGQRAGRRPEVLANERVALEKLLGGADFTGIALSVLDKEIFARALKELEGFDNQSLMQAQMLQVVATALQKLGLLEQARKPQEQALEIQRRLLGDEHHLTLTSINYLCSLLYSQGKLTEAEPLARSALDASRRTLGDEHARTLTSINNLGNLLKAQGKLGEAEPLYREALRGSRRILGDEHQDTIIAINSLGMLLLSQRKPDEAEPFLRAALSGQRRLNGDEHHLTLLAMGNMGGLLYNQGKLVQAEKLFREALEGSRRVRGDAHPATLNLIGNLGSALKAQDKLEESESLYREALTKKRRTLGNGHPSTLASINNMSSLLRSQNKFNEAEELARELIGERPATDPWHIQGKKLLDAIATTRKKKG
jgi:hypothetical protein